MEPETNTDPNELEQARSQALAWLKKLSPLLDDPAGLTTAEREVRLDLLPELRDDGPRALAALELLAKPEEDEELLKALREAVEQLDLLEGDLKRGTGGHWASDTEPEAEETVNPTVIRERLAAAAARREVEDLSDADGKSRLRLKVPPGSQAAAVFLGLTAVGTTVLTTINIKFIFPILLRMFGGWAYAALALYGAGYLAAVAMVRTGWLTIAAEQLDLEGAELTLRRHVGDWWSSTQRLILTPESHAVVTETSRGSSQSSWNPRTASVEICDAAGKVIHVAYGRPQSQQERLVQRLNSYIAELPKEPTS